MVGGRKDPKEVTTPHQQMQLLEKEEYLKKVDEEMKKAKLNAISN